MPDLKLDRQRERVIPAENLTRLWFALTIVAALRPGVALGIMATYFETFESTITAKLTELGIYQGGGEVE